jgi:hypothetical protein
MSDRREQHDRDQQRDRMREAIDEKREEARTKAEEDQLAEADRPPDEMSVRAKSTGHKKKTADKWNQ